MNLNEEKEEIDLIWVIFYYLNKQNTANEFIKMATGYDGFYEHYDNNYDNYSSDAHLKLDDFIVQTGDFLDSKVGISISDHDVAQDVLIENIKDENLNERLSKDVYSIEDCEKYNSDADIKLEDFIVEAGDFRDSKAGISLISDDFVAQDVLLENIKDKQVNKDVDIAENWEIGLEKIETLKVETYAKNENVPTLHQDPLLEDNRNHVNLELNNGLSLEGNSKHTSRENPNARIVLCKKSNRMFDYGVQVDNHAGNTQYKCDICHKGFVTSHLLEKHKLLHSESTPSSYKIRDHTCGYCGLICYRSSDMTKHIRTHTGEKPFTCEICKRSFCRRSALNDHIKTHTGEKPFTCEVCEMPFRWKNGLMRHIKTHTGEKPFTCEVCKTSFCRKSVLMIHVRIHTGEKPFTCEVCKMSFRQRCALIGHIKTHTGEKPFTCDVCNVSFSEKNRLMSHTRTHTGEKPFTCKVCKKPFRWRSGLSSHIKTHITEKSFVCEVCKQSFDRSSGLKRHMAVHVGDCPYSCDVCSTKFKTKKSLIRHMKLHIKEKV